MKFDVLDYVAYTGNLITVSIQSPPNEEQEALAISRYPSSQLSEYPDETNYG